MEEILRFRMLMIAAGYEDGIDANTLRADPVFKMALERAPGARDLCSQSTISRLENLPDRRMLLRMGRAMVALYCASFAQAPRHITLDIDDICDAVRGGQQLRLFNAHYNEYGFQPIMVFDGAGRFVTAVLRPAKRPSGREIAAHLRRLIRKLRSHWPRVEILREVMRRRKSRRGIRSSAYCSQASSILFRLRIGLDLACCATTRGACRSSDGPPASRGFAAPRPSAPNWSPGLELPGGCVLGGSDRVATLDPKGPLWKFCRRHSKE